MSVEQIAKLTPIDRLLYWIKERHSIYIARQQGAKPPWSDDPIFQTTYFTNPYRENDRVTIWLRNNIRAPLANNQVVLFATIAFRWFNWPATGELLNTLGLMTKWDEAEAVDALTDMWNSGMQVFSGAYIISAGKGGKGSKLRSVCSALTKVWNKQNELVDVCSDTNTLVGLWSALKNIKYLGSFMAAQIVADIKYTHLLNCATDWYTWCAPGPGSVRGLNMVLGRPPGPPPKDFVGEVNKLRIWINSNLARSTKFEEFHAQDVQSCLCEFSKYERVRTGGKSKRKYNGHGH